MSLQLLWMLMPLILGLLEIAAMLILLAMCSYFLIGAIVDDGED